MVELERRLGRPSQYFYRWTKAEGGDDNYYSYHRFDYGKNREGY